MFWVITASSRPPPLELGQSQVRRVRLLVAEHLRSAVGRSPRSARVSRWKASIVATFIGSTFAHSPLPGVRKSGIPDGTEIPAPVRATTRSAEPISSASARVGLDRAAHGQAL